MGRVYKVQGSGEKMVAFKKLHITKLIKNSMLKYEACTLAILAGHPSISSIYAH
jgi:hypothetical protein